jgi:hypothetical protein
MQFVIDQADFARLSSTARSELLRLLGAEGPPSAAPSAPSSSSRRNFRWRQPHDVSQPLLRKLLKGADMATRGRLAIFARNNGRASMKQLLSVTKEKDWHVLTPWEGAITRKLRRLVGDDNRIISLMQWDYEAEVWDADHSRLLDGVYYVSAATTKALRKELGLD